MRAFVCLATILSAAAGAAGDKMIWKPVQAAVLKVDNQPVKLWNVYEGGKKSRFVLVQLGQRYLILDTKAQRVYETDPATLQHKGDNLIGHEPNKSDKALASAAWDQRDVGFAEMVRFKLVGEGRVLEVQLPHPLDPRVAY